MTQEIELKLALTPRQVPLIRHHPILQCIPSRKQCVRNVYLDTPELILKQQRVALRRRQIGEQWWLTVKTADPIELSTGLSRRQEWEYPMPPDQLDFSPIDASQLRQLLVTATPSLGVVFRTDFVRTTWQIRQGDSLIEAALDLGYIRVAQTREHLCELELEIIEGREPDLLLLATSLQSTLPLTPLALSKAARGYSLMLKNQI